MFRKDRRRINTGNNEELNIDLNALDCSPTKMGMSGNSSLKSKELLEECKVEEQEVDFGYEEDSVVKTI